MLLADVLEEAGVDPRATQLLSTSADGWTCGTPVAALLDGRDALLAVGMNGEPLPISHGFPVRMVVPGLYGYVSATKWVVDLKLTTWEDDVAYWVPRGWAREAPVKTMSRVDVPREGAERDPGPTAVAGVAWAPHRGISAVEVRVDDGPWQEARLGTVPSEDSWVQWVSSGTPRPAITSSPSGPSTATGSSNPSSRRRPTRTVPRAGTAATSRSATPESRGPAAGDRARTSPAEILDKSRHGSRRSPVSSMSAPPGANRSSGNQAGPRAGPRREWGGTPPGKIAMDAPGGRRIHRTGRPRRRRADATPRPLREGPGWIAPAVSCRRRAPRPSSAARSAARRSSSGTS